MAKWYLLFLSGSGRIRPKSIHSIKWNWMIILSEPWAAEPTQFNSIERNNIISFWLGLRESAPGKATGNGAGNEPRNEPRKGTKTKPFRGAGKLRKPLFSLCFAQNWPPKGEPKMNPKWSPKWPLKWTGFGSLKGWTAIRKKINANSHGSDNYFSGPQDQFN